MARPLRIEYLGAFYHGKNEAMPGKTCLGPKETGRGFSNASKRLLNGFL